MLYLPCVARSNSPFLFLPGTFFFFYQGYRSVWDMQCRYIYVYIIIFFFIHCLDGKKCDRGHGTYSLQYHNFFLFKFPLSCWDRLILQALRTIFLKRKNNHIFQSTLASTFRHLAYKCSCISIYIYCILNTVYLWKHGLLTENADMITDDLINYRSWCSSLVCQCRFSVA